MSESLKGNAEVAELKALPSAGKPSVHFIFALGCLACRGAAHSYMVALPPQAPDVKATYFYNILVTN
jgi:hypothetical protein